MSYFTGSASSPSDLKTLIETKAVLAGWSLSGDWLSKGLSSVKLLAPNTNFLNITGANSADGATQPAGFTRSIYVPTAAWPVTYYLHLNTSPDVVALVVKHSTNKIQHLFFGNMVKIHNSAFVGGNFFYATNTLNAGNDAGGGLNFADIGQLRNGSNDTGITIDSLFTGAFAANDGGNSVIVPFASHFGANFRENGIHVEIDTTIWDTTGKVTLTDTTISSLFRSPNLYNSQTHLVPINLQYAMSDNLFGYLGYIEHIRLVRVDNYEIGDTITISPDTWKVYPCLKKDTIYRNGGTGAGPGTSGTIGLAIRYDGV